MKIESVYVEILNKCNMHCCYCYNDSAQENLAQMSKDQFLKIIELIRKYKCSNIWISGGEPFLHPDIKDFMEICKENCLNLGIATNGTCVAEFVTDICKYNPSLQISLDSTDKDINNRYRGEGAYENAVKAIALLNDSNYCGTLSIKSTLYNENSNVNSISAMINFCEINGIGNVFFSPCVLQGRAINKDFLVPKPIICEPEVESSCVHIQYTRPIYSCELLGDIVNVPLNLRITPTGDVFPCHHLPYVVFNCFDAIDDLIINESLRDIQHKIKDLLSCKPDCISCICKKICNGGCPARRIYEDKHSDLVCDDIKRDYIIKIEKLIDGVK